MPQLSARDRARLPPSAFAYVDSRGTRRLPIHDASHVRNALARFDQVAFEDDAARERARERLLRAAKKYGIVPLGFFGVQLRKERIEGELRARSGDVRSLPRGRVTFLFTDMEGSTKLIERLGDGYAKVLRDVRAAIRAAVKRSDGHEVDARADEFFAVFRRASDALGAAFAIQTALRERSRRGKVDVRVRVGVHTGRTTLTDTGYVGIAVHTAARVCATANGGQILLTAATREAADRSAFRDAHVRRVGPTRLEGIADPVVLFELVAP